MSIYKLTQNDFWGSFGYGILRQFFDCLDGTMARKYDMSTEFGDIYDHISDLMYAIALITYTGLINKQSFIIILGSF